MCGSQNSTGDEVVVATRRIIALAQAAAARSNERWRVGAVIYSGSTVLGVGTNDMTGTSPKSPHAFRTRHAEFNALMRVPEAKRRGSSVFVYRVGRDLKTHLAKPCPACQAMLDWSGVKRIEWSVEDGIYERGN